MSYYNEVIIKEWLCFDLARYCINSYFEQTKWQQPADAKRYLSSIIYVFHSLSLALFLSFTPHTHTLKTSHMVVRKHTHCQGCARLPRRSCTNAQRIAFPVRQKLAQENGSFRHFMSVFWFRVKHDSHWDRWSHILPQVIHLSVHSKALADLMGADIMRGTSSSCLLRVKSSTHPNHHLQEHSPGGAAPHYFQPLDPNHTRSHTA